MAFTYSSVMMICLLLSLYSLLQCESHNHHLRLKLDDDHASTSHHTDIKDDDPELSLFFHYNNLKPGNKILVYFAATKDPSSSPRLLSREESDSIPFSTSEFTQILQFFSFDESSKQAVAMKGTLRHCEFPPMKGEAKFCATSLESMLDSVREVFGFGSRFKVIETKYISGTIAPLQNYTVIESDEMLVSKMMACHLLPYPYAVYYCHGQVSDNKLFRILLEGDADGNRVEAAGICHMDTSQWDPNHISFRVLKTIPGHSPVCHFFPADNLVWVKE